MNYVLIFIGGGVGAIARYWLSGAVYKAMGTTFPYGTLAVNLLGCFFIGFLMTVIEERFLIAPQYRVFLAIGILGGFTTFSSFSFETLEIFREGNYYLALLNVCTSIAGCLVATFIGALLGRVL